MIKSSIWKNNKIRGFFKKVNELSFVFIADFSTSLCAFFLEKFQRLNAALNYGT